ncbi:MAG: Ig-like domain-containing protein [Oscillospiraceae bacterium]|nr:Ig-like domain-containing protein [Oscillospiraceae bacterium]
MKKTAKRILSLALVMVMMLGLSVTTSAKSRETLEVGDTILVNAPFGNAWDIQWTGYDSSIIAVYPDYDGYQAYVMGLRAGSTTITLYATSSDDDGNYSFLTQYISVTVTESKSKEDPLYVYMEGSGSMDVGGVYYLSAYASGGDGRYSYTWDSSNTNVARVSGRGDTVTVSAVGGGKTTISVRVSSGTQTEYAYFSLSVTARKTATTYDASGSANVGSNLSLNTIANSISNAFRRDLGLNLDYSAAVRFSTTSNNYGTLCFGNGGEIISTRTSYSAAVFADMVFIPNSAGTFSTSYSITQGEYSISGVISISVRGASLSASISPSTMSLATYSNQYLSLSVSPRNSYYSVTWSSSNTNIATVSGSGDSVTVNTKGTAGTATITARITDTYGAVIIRECTVTVTSSANYSPSVSTTLGVPYTGTGTSSAMIQQFRSIYGVTINNDTARIRFSSTGNNNVAVMRLSNGTAVQANTDYSMTQYIAMYTDPISAGTFSIPYTLTYNNQSLTGDVSVVISANTVSVGVNLSGTDAYSFNTASAVGMTGSDLLNNTVTNAVGMNWSCIRFGTAASNVGTLYTNSNLNPIANSTVYPSGLSSLYFVPASSGTYSISFTVCNNSGSTLANGTLNIIVPAAASKPQIDPSKIPPVTPTPKDKVGTVAGDYYYTDIVTTVNGTVIESINVGGMTLINVEDLRTHGFTVEWNGSARTLRAARSSTAPRTGSATAPRTSGTVGARLGSYYYTDIVTYLDGYAINGYNTDGRTFICAEDMRYYGYNVVWDGYARTLTITG